MAITGKGGSVTFESDVIAELSNWSLDLSVDEVDVTSFDSDGWKEFLAGLKEWSGSFEGNLKYSDPVSGSKKGQKVLFDAWKGSDEVKTIVLEVNSEVSFTGSAFLTSLSVNVPVDDKADFSSDFRGTGELTVA